MLLGSVAFVIVSPAGLLALPVAVLLVTLPPRSPREILATVIAGGLALGWLASVGDLPGQVVRGAAVTAACVFAYTARFARARLTHRAVLSVGAAVLVAGAVLVIFGHSWQELQWWVHHRISYTIRLIEGGLLSAGGPRSANAAEVAEFLTAAIQWVTEYFPAIVSIQLLAGLALATAIYRRVADRPRGAPGGPLRDFGFTDHLGWAAIPPLVVVLTPTLHVARTGAMNLLIVLGTLYGLRGIAVVASRLHYFGGGPLWAAVLVVSALLMLPVAAPCAILLGVVDSRMHLRHRWTTSS